MAARWTSVATGCRSAGMAGRRFGRTRWGSWPGSVWSCGSTCTSRAVKTLNQVGQSIAAEDSGVADPVAAVRGGYDRWAAVYDHDANPLQALEGPVVRAAVGDVRG